MTDRQYNAAKASLMSAFNTLAPTNTQAMMLQLVNRMEAKKTDHKKVIAFIADSISLCINSGAW